MKKKILAVVLIAGLIFMYGCGSSGGNSKSSSKSGRSSKQTESAQKKSDSNSASSSAKNGSDSSTSSTSEQSGENDPGDAGNNDPTKETAQNNTVQQMKQKYIGSWEEKGLLMSDGSIDDSDGSSGTLTVKDDGTYTMSLTDSDGKTTETSGNWSINSDKKLVVGSYTMGIDDNGYLLRDSGQRDGKGFRLYYAFKSK
ncbi:MAG: copper resistance protein NlpE [Eubacterium sp.]|jgi:DNA mismatch repair ATPase MutL|nr:copper resistance protein NlpE [Eubacterium sp.]MCH4047064.1 copper resistance protein NlpE [Eubacterium sp.]MCH4080161.1 copper resistance protein NlpE [Eubacterium sp.]MCH4110949.1 copper resistance protein NlpE [Eubacterium sp.]MCI1306792.1 copper resistance protein NlpE [Eubacterium sp.]